MHGNTDRRPKDIGQYNMSGENDLTAKVYPPCKAAYCFHAWPVTTVVNRETYRLLD